MLHIIYNSLEIEIFIILRSVRHALQRKEDPSVLKEVSVPLLGSEGLMPSCRDTKQPKEIPGIDHCTITIVFVSSLGCSLYVTVTG